MRRTITTKVVVRGYYRPLGARRLRRFVLIARDADAADRWAKKHHASIVEVEPCRR